MSTGSVGWDPNRGHADSTSLPRCLGPQRESEKSGRPGPSGGHVLTAGSSCWLGLLRALPCGPPAGAHWASQHGSWVPQSRCPQKRRQAKTFKTLRGSHKASLLPHYWVRWVTNQAHKEGTETPTFWSRCHCENTQDGRQH